MSQKLSNIFKVLYFKPLGHDLLECLNTMNIRVRQNHITLQLKLKKQLAYNCDAIIPWVLQLLCNYPVKNIVY
jgi:hypothetical protein